MPYRSILIPAAMALSSLLLMLIGCPSSDPPEAICTQIDVVPQQPVLPADATTYTYIDIAVCACSADGDGEPCAEDDLMKGRVVYLAVDRGTLTPGDSLYLQTGRAQLQLASSDRQETGSVSVWTSDGFTGSAAVQYIAPMAMETDSLALDAGAADQVKISDAIGSVEALVSDEATLNAEYDSDQKSLVVNALADVAVDTDASVTVEDSMGQTATLTVTVSAAIEEDTALAIEPSYVYMAPGDPAIEFEAINANGVEYWSSAYGSYLQCDEQAFNADNCISDAIWVSLEGDPWTDGHEEITIWVTDGDGAQAAATIGHL